MGLFVLPPPRILFSRMLTHTYLRFPRCGLRQHGALKCLAPAVSRNLPGVVADEDGSIICAGGLKAKMCFLYNFFTPSPVIIYSLLPLEKFPIFRQKRACSSNYKGTSFLEMLSGKFISPTHFEKPPTACAIGACWGSINQNN